MAPQLALRHRSLLFILVFLIFSVMISGCDPAPMPFFTILQVVSVDEDIYAYGVQRTTWGPGCCDFGKPAFYFSQDKGKTWQLIESPPQELDQKLSAAKSRYSQTCQEEQPQYCKRVDGLGQVLHSEDGGITWPAQLAAYPVLVDEAKMAKENLDYRSICSQVSPKLCFRLTEDEKIERSEDGGRNWVMDWQMDPIERTMMEFWWDHDRDHKGIPYGFQPLDLAVVDTANGVYVIAAMGTQGVMLRSPEGEWETLAVAEATPLK